MTSCDNKDGPFEWLFINGSEQSRLCSGCFSEAIVDLVTNNDSVHFIRTGEHEVQVV